MCVLRALLSWDTLALLAIYHTFCTPDSTCPDLWIHLFSFSLSELLLLPSLYNTMCYKTLKIDNWWMLKTAIVCFKNTKMLLNIAHEEKGRAKNVGSSSKWLLGIFQDGGPLIPRPSLFSKMATKSNFSPSQGTVVDIKISTQAELHKVKFPWVARPLPPILGQTIDRCIKLILNLSLC